MSKSKATNRKSGAAVRSSELVGRGCVCQLCRLSRAIQRIATKCTEHEKAALDILWERMESAEMEFDWLCADALEGKPIELGGLIYVPRPPNAKLTDAGTKTL